MPEQIWDAATGFRAIAPGTKTTRSTMVSLGAVTAVGAFLTLTLLAARVGFAGRALAMASTLLIIGGLGFAGMWMWLNNVRLLIGQGVVGYRNFFGRSRFWSRGEVDRIVSMAISYGKSSQAQRVIYCFELDGKRLLALSVRAWQSEDLKDFVEATGRPLDFRDGPITAKDARSEFPKAFGWSAEHVVLLTSLTMLGAGVLAVAGYLLISKLLLK